MLIPDNARSLVLQEIAGEKAGIFKAGVPAFTVPQPREAMQALEVRTAGACWVQHICAAALILRR